MLHDKAKAGKQPKVTFLRLLMAMNLQGLNLSIVRTLTTILKMRSSVGTCMTIRRQITNTLSKIALGIMRKVNSALKRNTCLRHTIS